MNISQQQLDAMCSVIAGYKEESREDSDGGYSWQYCAGLSGVGDITLIRDEAKLAQSGSQFNQTNPPGIPRRAIHEETFMLWKFIFLRLTPGAWLRSDNARLRDVYYWLAAKSYWS